MEKQKGGLIYSKTSLLRSPMVLAKSDLNCVVTLIVNFIEGQVSDQSIQVPRILYYGNIVHVFDLKD